MLAPATTVCASCSRPPGSSHLVTVVRRFYFAGDQTSRWRTIPAAAAAALAIYVANSMFITATQLIDGALAIRSL